MAEVNKVIFDRAGKNKSIIKIKFADNISSKQLSIYLTAAISKCFKSKYYKIIIDLANIDDLPIEFTATLIEATAKIRTKKDGDIKIINLTDLAKQSMASFNAIAYLSMPKDEGE